MAARSNALSELTRCWLESRLRCLVTEGVPVPVPFGQSDLDLVATEPRGQGLTLPAGVKARSRLVVETKDEHDFDPRGKEFGKYLRSDVER